ncbi:MAG: FkbM family methyltransferase [Pseudomonadota bacterium]
MLRDMIRTRRFTPLAWRVASRFLNPRGVQTTAEFGDGLVALCDTRDKIESFLFYFGVWEPNISAFVRRRLKPGDVLADLGANIGYYSLIAAKAGARAVAFEAAPPTFERLAANVRMNGFEDLIRTVPKAIAGEAGMVEIVLGPVGNRGASTIEKSRDIAKAAGADTFEVEAGRLFDLMEPEEIDRLRLIKIDIEGAEAPALDDILERYAGAKTAPDVVCELSGAEAERYVRRFREAGFQAYRLINRYNWRYYVDDADPAPAARLDAVPDRQFDVVFSRENADAL